MTRYGVLQLDSLSKSASFTACYRIQMLRIISCFEHRLDAENRGSAKGFEVVLNAATGTDAAFDGSFTKWSKTCASCTSMS